MSILLANSPLLNGGTKLEIAMIRLINVFHEHCGSDKKLNKAELRKLLDEGSVIYQTIILWIKIFFCNINFFLRVRRYVENNRPECIR